MGRKPIGKRPLTATQRQRRWRSKVKHAVAMAHRAEVVSGLARASTVAASRLATMPLYNVLLVDPPWKFEVRSDAGRGRSAENHYPTMTLAELKALVVPAARDAILFMWTTSPMLAQSLDLLSHWGFTYGGFVAWDKQIIGTGYRFRGQVELLLYGTSGRGVPIPLPAERVANLVSIRRSQRHSEKPRAIADLIAHQYAGLPRVEMFGRSDPGDGWDVWGNEVPSISRSSPRCAAN
jgi:N6-adenosine-specific RNA methylase IME4